MNSWRTLSVNGSEAILSRFDGFESLSVENFDPTQFRNSKFACVIDIKTSGINPRFDFIVAIAIRRFYFDPKTGDILQIGPLYCSNKSVVTKEDTTSVIPTTKERLFTDETEWRKISDLLNSSHLVISHHAKHSRSFVDKLARYSERTVWGCSKTQINWLNYGFASRNLELLNAFHGYFVSNATTVKRADLILHLLSQNPEYLLELYRTAHEPKVRIDILSDSYEHKDLVRAAGYSWDPLSKSWNKVFPKKDFENEEAELNRIFSPKSPAYRRSEVPLSENFKSKFY